MEREPEGRYRLLVIEDHKDCADLIARVALECGYEASSIVDATSLQDAISHHCPDVITLDLCLPNVDGLEVLTLLKSLDFAGRLIIITGQPAWFLKQAVRLARAHELKVVAQMSKPIQVELLRELLNAIRTKSNQLRAAK